MAKRKKKVPSKKRVRKVRVAKRTTTPEIVADLPRPQIGDRSGSAPYGR